MTKIQKIWLGILAGVVLIPEFLFQSTVRLVYGVFSFKNIVLGNSYIVVLIQSVAALCVSIFLFSARKKFKHLWLCYLLIGVSLLWAIVGYLAYDTILNTTIEFRGF